MAGLRRIAFVGIVAVALVGLAGCPSPFLGRIKQEIAKSRLADTTYKFVRQWGNPHPEWNFLNPVVKVDTAGKVYVADSSFRIRKFDNTGVILKTYGFTSSVGFGAVYDMAFDGPGNMYIINSANQVQKYNVSGSLVTQWGDATLYNGLALNYCVGIAVNNNGVYVVDTGNNRVVRFDTSGTYIGTFGTSGSGDGAFSSPRQVALDRSGNVYVVDTYNYRVQVFDSTGVFLYKWGTSGTGNGQFGSPYGVAIDSGSTQYVYVADTGNSRIQKFTTAGAYLTQWGSSGTADQQFTSPNSVAIDSAGRSYVSDGNSFNGRIQKYDPPLNSTTAPAWNASWGGGAGSAPGITALPVGIAFDSSGNSLIADFINQRVTKFDPSGNYLLQIVSSTLPANQQFELDVTTIATDTTGHVYIPDGNGNEIQVFDTATGAWHDTVTNPGSPAFSGPRGIAIGKSGDMYVLDINNYLVQVLHPGPYFATSWGGGVSGTGNGQFTSSAYGIAVDKDGNCYVTDAELNRVQKFDSQGHFLLKWGSFGTGDGQFSFPIGIAVDADGYVFVCDMMNRRIQKFDSSGNYILQFGGAGVGGGTFGWPIDIAINAAGNIVVSDYTNALIQEFTPVLPNY